MSQTLFSPPANINDFGPNSNLASRWNQTLEGYLNNVIDIIKQTGINENEISIFDPRNPPPGQKSVVNVTWGGFPNVLLAQYGKGITLQSKIIIFMTNIIIYITTLFYISDHYFLFFT